MAHDAIIWTTGHWTTLRAMGDDGIGLGVWRRGMGGSPRRRHEPPAVGRARANQRAGAGGWWGGRAPRTTLARVTGAHMAWASADVQSRLRPCHLQCAMPTFVFFFFWFGSKSNEPWHRSN